MNKAIALVTLLGFAIVANAAGVQIYFTNGTTDSYGLASLSDALNPSAAVTSNDGAATYADNLDVTTTGAPYDMMSPAMFAPFVAPGQPCPEIAVPGDVIYVWGQFDDGFATGAKLRSIKGGIAEADPQTCEPLTQFDGTWDQPVFADLGGAVAWYKFDALGSLGAERWDGASTEADNYSTFRQNPQELTAVTAYGIKTNMAPGTELPLGQANAVGGGEIFLLGAIDASALDPSKCYTYAVAALPQNGSPMFVVDSTPLTPRSTCFSVLPEPASLLLVGLAGLLIRRR